MYWRDENVEVETNNTFNLQNSYSQFFLKTFEVIWSFFNDV